MTNTVRPSNLLFSFFLLAATALVAVAASPIVTAALNIVA